MPKIVRTLGERVVRKVRKDRAVGGQERHNTLLRLAVRLSPGAYMISWGSYQEVVVSVPWREYCEICGITPEEAKYQQWVWQDAVLVSEKISDEEAVFLAKQGVAVRPGRLDYSGNGEAFAAKPSVDRAERIQDQARRK